MTIQDIPKTRKMRNKFIELPYPICGKCQGSIIIFNCNWKKNINKQRELYQKQHFPQKMLNICQCNQH